MAYTKDPQHLYRTCGRWRIVCRDGSTEYYYRALMAAHLGRELEPGEQVHHRNGDSYDDRIENLELTTASAHGAHHSPEGHAARRARWRFDWSRDFAACRGCSTTARPHYCKGYCQRCYHRIYMRRRRAAKEAA